MAYDPRTATGIPTEPVGSLPRPSRLQAAYADYDAGTIGKEQLEAQQDAAVQDSISRMEAAGSPIVSDGEQRWSSFATYAITDTLAGTGLAPNLGGGGQYFAIFADGHNRQLPRLTGGPFRYQTYAADTLAKSIGYATRPMKQAVIAPSMLALLYPLDESVPGYPRDAVRAGPGQRVREGHPPGVRGRRRAGLDRLHRGPPGDARRPAQPVDRGRHAPPLHRAQQPGARALLRRGARQHRRAHLPRRRPRLGAQRRRPLQRPAAEPVQHRRRLLPDPDGQRARQGPRPEDDRRAPARRPRRGRRWPSSG